MNFEHITRTAMNDPYNQQIKSPDTAVDIIYNEENNIYSATIELVSKYKDVTVSFIDVDKPESGNLISTAPVKTLRTSTTIKNSQLKDIMPSGYVLAYPEAEIPIVEITEGEKITYSATVSVKPENTQPGWVVKNDNWFYYDKNGIMLTGWQKINESWFYFHSNGVMASNEFVDDCYVDENGHMASDEVTPDGYTVDKDGHWI